MFFGRPTFPMGAPGTAMPGAPAAAPMMPAAAPMMPAAAPLPPSGLLNLDMDAGPGLVNMDMGPYATGMEHMESGMHCAPKVHVVVRGDTVWKISRHYNISTQAIIQANNLRYPDLIYPGQRLVIPDGLSYGY